MNRRSFLGLLGALPFLRWLKPKPEPKPSIWCGPLSPLEHALWKPPSDGMDHRLDALHYASQGYPFRDLTNPLPYGGSRKSPYLMVKPMSWTDEEIMQPPNGGYSIGPCVSGMFGDHSDCGDGCFLKR